MVLWHRTTYARRCRTEATSADFDFLFNLHKQTFYSYIEQTWSWNEERQAISFREELSKSPFAIVRYVGEDVSCISVINAGEALDLNYIAILPTFQVKGLRIRLMQALENQLIAREILI